MNKAQHKGRLFVISAPSGAGKSTLCDMLTKHLHPNVTYSVSYTTRQMRDGEQNGVNYHFVSKEEFFGMVENDEFLEWAEVHGNLYGTAMSSIEKSLGEGYDVFLDIDPQGAMQLRERVPHAVYIFITAPSIEALHSRITSRGKDSAESIAIRLKNAYKEVEYYCEYDYLVVNDEKERAFNELLAIYNAEHLRTFLYEKSSDFMKM